MFRVSRYKNEYDELRTIVLSKLADLKEELKTVRTAICQQALEHVHANEIVMTTGSCVCVVVCAFV